MHKRFVVNIISRILLIVCFAMFAPLAWAIHDNPHALEVSAFVETILLGLLAAVVLRSVFPLKQEDFDKATAKDGLAIVALSWVVLSAFGALPFVFSHVVPSFTDAFFETVSGFTTTGASIFTNVEILPRGILFWRSLTHWLGGMGIIVLYLALLPALGTNAYQLYKAETSGLKAEKIAPKIKQTAKNLWLVYFFLTFVLLCLLLLGGMPIFDALCHTFGAIATGGFSTKNASIGAYSPYIQWVITIFMFLGGTNFILHYQALSGRPGRMFRNEEFQLYVIIVCSMIAVFSLVLFFYGDSASPVRDSAFQVVSIMTATGYSTVDFNHWPAVLKFLLIILMFIGGCGGSTSGGLKVVRLLMTVKISFQSVVQAIFPNAVTLPKFNKQPINERLAASILSYFAIYTIMFFVGAVLFSFTESCHIDTAMSATISALSSVGPGLGRVGPAGNYAWVSIPGKWILIFLMLAGRLELYSFLVLFLPATWKK